jgi:hypothetical protein
MLLSILYFSNQTELYVNLICQCYGNFTFKMQTILVRKISKKFNKIQSLIESGGIRRYKSVKKNVTLFFKDELFSLEWLQTVLLWYIYDRKSKVLNMSEFKYLPGIVLIVIFEYLLILAAFKYCGHLDKIENESNVEGMLENKENKVQTTAFRFEDTYNSFLPGLKYILFVTRFLSFCYLTGISLISE